jgi:hypothetical protein
MAAVAVNHAFLLCRWLVTLHKAASGTAWGAGPQAAVLAVGIRPRDPRVPGDFGSLAGRCNLRFTGTLHLRRSLIPHQLGQTFRCISPKCDLRVHLTLHLHEVADTTSSSDGNLGVSPKLRILRSCTLREVNATASAQTKLSRCISRCVTMESF